VSSGEHRGFADLFRVQEMVCRGLGSPLWADMCTRFADEIERGGAMYEALAEHEDASIESAFPLRVLGGVHRLALAGDAPTLADHLPSTGGDGDPDAIWDGIRAQVWARPGPLVDALTRPPQTNEVGRAAALIGGFLVIAAEARLPLRVLEIGSSAGLNLRFDRFRYEQDGVGFGPSDAAVRFSGFWPTGGPPWDAALEVESRHGCDLDPVDVTTRDGELTLLSYVWPDQLERFERTAAAIRIARAVPATVERADAVTWLRDHVAPTPGVATVMFHSIMWQYLSDETKAEIAALLEAAGGDASEHAPLAWLRLENDVNLAQARLALTTWPGGVERTLAHCSFHLGPVEWFEP
jgi:hypothetical protein